MNNRLPPGPTKSYYDLRMDVCRTCPYMKKRPLVGPQCMSCGCFLVLKAKIPNQSCPENRWPI